MPSASQRTELIIFERATETENEYADQLPVWSTYATRRAYVRFGTAQEKREAAQEGSHQTATFECETSAALRAVTTKDRISYLSDPDVPTSYWDLSEVAPLDTKTIRFTGSRRL
jgi:head-tail adaptor